MSILLELILIVGLVTALFDMVGNGSLNAYWAPWGLLCSLACAAILQFGYGWH